MNTFHREHILLKLKIKKLLRKIRSKNLPAGVFFFKYSQQISLNQTYREILYICSVSFGAKAIENTDHRTEYCLYA